MAGPYHEALDTSIDKPYHRPMAIKRIFVDVETTGRTKNHGIVQLAAIVEIDVVTDTFVIECAPHEQDLIEPDAMKVHGRTLEQVRAYMPPLEAHAKFVSFLEKHVDKFNKNDKLFFIAYNAPFDSDMLRAWFEKAKDTYFGSWFWTPAICAMTLAGERLIERRASLPNFKFATVCEAAGIKLENAHDALADATAAMELYRWATERKF